MLEQSTEIHGAQNQGFHSKLPLWISLYVIAGSTAVLLGWYLNINFLKRPVADFVAMNPLTAFSFVLTGIALVLALQKSKPVQTVGFTLSVIVIILSFLRLTESVGLIDFRVDRVLLESKVQEDVSSGLISAMSILTSVQFILAAFAVIALQLKGAKMFVYSQISSLLVFVFSFISVLGYLYRSPEFYDLLAQVPIALHTAVHFMFLALATLLISRNEGLVKHLFGRQSGGKIGRVLLLSVVLIPIVLGIIRFYVLESNLVSAQFETTLLITGIILIFSAIIVHNVVLLNKRDTLRRTSEEELRQSENLFRTLVNSIQNYAVFRLDLNGNILTWNSGAETIKGYSESEILGRNISLFYTPEDLEVDLPKELLSLAAEHGAWEQEGWRMRKNNSRFWASVYLSTVLNHNNEVMGFTKVTRDMTQQRNAQELLEKFNEELNERVKEQTAEITDRNKNLEQFSFIVSHNLRSPVANIIGLCNLLSTTTLDEEQKEKTISVLVGSAKKLDDIILDLNDILNVKHKLSDSKETIQLAPLLEGVVESLKGTIETKKAVITSNFDEVNEVNSIKSYIRSIFYNLISNSLKYSRPGIQPEIEVWSQNHPDHLALHFKDNGLGFDLKKSGDDVFKLYKRFHHEHAEGKGMGLYLVKTQLENIGGKITLESTVNKGTHFTLIIPTQ